jgi:ubiquinone/menaquinone biosynthesis C-methylase UbiE
VCFCTFFNAILVRAERLMQPDRSSFFDKVGSTYADTYAAVSISGHVLTRRRNLVSALLAGENGGALLDIGCGAGNYIPIARACRFTYVGLDASEAMVDGCRQTIGDAADASVLVASAVSLPVQQSSCDAVLALGVFEYLEVAQRGHAFDEIARVVKPGGLIIGSFANHYSPYRTWFRWRGASKTPESLRFREFKLAEVRSMLEARGLTIEQTIPLGINPFPPPIAERLPRMAARFAHVMRGRAGQPLRVLAMANLVVARRPKASAQS